MAMDDIGKVNHRAEDDIGTVTHREEETIFNDFTARRNAIIKALTEENDICKFRNLCEKYDIPVVHSLTLQKMNILASMDCQTGHGKSCRLVRCLYFFHIQNYINFLIQRRTKMSGWPKLLMIVIHGYDNNQSERLFNKINELPTIYEVITGNDKNQEAATEKAKKRVEDKSTVSVHCKAFSNSDVVQRGMSSSRLIKDLKREGKKAITKRERPMRSAIQTRSKARRI